MTDTAILGAFAFMVGLLVLTLACGALVHLARDWAEDRAREARYADEWIAAHRAHQHDDRYITEREGAPE